MLIVCKMIFGRRNLSVFQSVVTVLLFAFEMLLCIPAAAQVSPYDQFPEAEPPYYRVRYAASTEDGGLAFGVNYTIWVPDGNQRIRGVIVHQHGCGEGSCKSGLSGAFDLHWQALAEKHHCVLMAPAYEQPAGADCQLWCDPRNGSSDSFQRALVDLGRLSEHPELASVPWALWGHSGGGHWAGGMVLLHPEKIAAAWLRSGVPLLTENPDRASIKPHQLPDESLEVPIMCNPGTKEGVTVKDGRFARVWPANELFFGEVRSRGGLIGIAVDPLTSHECGNQRYLAIRWLDQCLALRLPFDDGGALRSIDKSRAWLAVTPGLRAVPATEFKGDVSLSTWLPNEEFAKLWMQYVKDTKVEDLTRPPSPRSLSLESGVLTWIAKADMESGIEKFLILRDGELIGEVVSNAPNRFGRQIFQGLLYSDTPTLPLSEMQFVVKNSGQHGNSEYQVVTVNTVGRRSEPSLGIRATVATPNQ